MNLLTKTTRCSLVCPATAVAAASATATFASSAIPKKDPTAWSAHSSRSYSRMALLNSFSTTSKTFSKMTYPTGPAANIKGAPHHTASHYLAPAPTDLSTSNSSEARKFTRTQGLIPPAIETFEAQEQRCLAMLDARKTGIEKWQYLSVLKNADVHLFYRVFSKHVKTLTPFIYTPTVGEACQRWSELYTQPEGMYLSYDNDKGNIHNVLKNWPHDVEITVLTDGSRILGLGDLGINGMGIPIGKLALYTACAGIHPLKTLPLTIDLGTSNEALRNDPLYLGSRRPKVTAEQEKEFLDELMAALTEVFPGIVIQFEDFKNPFPSLERYEKTFTMFNDDIQGTGAVILGGFINAVKQSGVAAKDQRAVFFGAGSAGVGVAKQLTEFFINEGLSEEEAKKRFWLVDSKGLVTLDRGELADHKVYFARDDNEGQQIKTLQEVVEYVKPTILMGLSTSGGAFTPEILSRMAELNEHPVIFPLSNPSDKSECTFEDAVKYTNGKCLFASGSPFPTLTHNGKELSPGQGNNVYVFPGIGQGAILSKAVNVTQGMIYASGQALPAAMLPSEVAENWLYPDISRIRDVSVIVTRYVIRAAQKDGVDRELALRNITDAQLDEYIIERMYDPFTAHKEVQDEIRDIASGLNGGPHSRL